MGFFTRLFSRKKPSQGSGEGGESCEPMENDMSEMIEPDQMSTEVMITDQNGRPVNVDPRGVILGNPNVPNGLPGITENIPRRNAPIQASKRDGNPPAQQQVAPQPQARSKQIQPGYAAANPGVPRQFHNQQPQQQQYDQPYDQNYNQPQPQQQRRPVPPPQVPFFEIYTDKSIGAYNLYVDLPGVEHDSINIEYTEEGNAVTITGNRVSIVDKLKAARTGRGKNKEISIEESHSTIPSLLMGEFVFSLPFNKSIDPQNIRMEYTDGVLWVQLPHRVKGEKVVISLKKQKPTEDV